MPAKKVVAPVPATPVKADKKAVPAVTTPAPATATKASKAEKVAPAPAPATVPAPAPETEEVADSPLVVLEEKLSAFSALYKELIAQVKLVKKEMERMRRITDRVEKKRANARTTPNGFAKPTKISDELCVFLSVPKGTEKARTDVTREIHKYVKTKNLSDPSNKRIILAHKDATLKKLLNCTDKDEITYFNLQKFLKHHFVKA